MKRTYEHFIYPEKFLAELLQKSARGDFVERTENNRVIFRALVVAVDTEGGKLENPNASGAIDGILEGKDKSFNAISGPANPRNAIKARIMTHGMDQFSSDEELAIFWPMFPEHMSQPIKPGEYAYVLFEDESRAHGLWFSKVSGHENVNFKEGEKSLNDDKSNNLSQLFSDTKVESKNVDMNKKNSGRKSSNGSKRKLFPDTK